MIVPWIIFRFVKYEHFKTSKFKKNLPVKNVHKKLVSFIDLYLPVIFRLESLFTVMFMDLIQMKMTNYLIAFIVYIYHIVKPF